MGAEPRYAGRSEGWTFNLLPREKESNKDGERIRPKEAVTTTWFGGGDPAAEKGCGACWVGWKKKGQTRAHGTTRLPLSKLGFCVGNGVYRNLERFSKKF